MSDRPTRSKFNDTTRNQILADLRDGVPRRYAAKRAGVSYATLKSWLRSARQGAEFYADFAEQVQQAEASAVSTCVKAVVKASRPRRVTTVKRITLPDGSIRLEETTRVEFSWQAAAWWLERLHPAAFSNEAKELRELKKQVDEIRKLYGMGDGDTP